MIAAPIMLSIPNFAIAICAPRLNQSQKILKPVVTAVKTLMEILRTKGEHWRVITENQQCFEIECVSEGLYHDQRSLTAYPGDPTVRRLRTYVLLSGFLRMKSGYRDMRRRPYVQVDPYV